MNLFLTEDDVLKLGYYGLTTQAECYSIKGMECDDNRSFAPEVFEEVYVMKSDVWLLGIALIELMGIKLYCEYDDDRLTTEDGYDEYPFDYKNIKSGKLADFLQSCFETEVDDRWSVNELMTVSVMG